MQQLENLQVTETDWAGKDLGGVPGCGTISSPGWNCPAKILLRQHPAAHST